eukprot:40845-Chlamydomonas_euryale.AAC.3
MDAVDGRRGDRRKGGRSVCASTRLMDGWMGEWMEREPRGKIWYTHVFPSMKAIWTTWLLLVRSLG